MLDGKENSHVKTTAELFDSVIEMCESEAEMCESTAVICQAPFPHLFVLLVQDST